MFPNLKFNISGLDPTKRYHMYLDMLAVDDRRYKYGYHNSRWLVAGRSDPPPVDPPSYYVHPSSPSTGANWMRQVVSFDKVKLTNNETNGSEQARGVEKNTWFHPSISLIDSSSLIARSQFHA